MLMSRACSSGTLMLATDAHRDDVFACPECDEAVMLKRGSIVVPHFAHYADIGCPLSQGESMRHLEMKLQIGALFENATYEVRFGAERRADVLIENVVVECQASAISIEEVTERTRFYNSQDKGVLWVFDLERLGQAWTTTIDSIRVLGEVRVPAEMRFVHRSAYGFLYVLDAFGRLYGCHLAPVARAHDVLGPYHLKATKRPLFHRAGQVPQSFLGTDGQLRFVRLGEGVWWRRGQQG
jgi:hypothetical protein